MSNLLQNLTKSLNKLDWSALDIAHQQVEMLLRDLLPHRELLKDELKDLSNTQTNQLTELSIETTTHYKWYIYKEPTLNYRIWLHEYKPKTRRTLGYAEVLHNHRYWFTSWILKGGFNHLTYEVKRSRENVSLFEGATLSSEKYLNTNTIYSVKPEAIHALSNFAEPTITLIVRSRAVKDFSESFDLQSKIITCHHSFHSRIQDFRNMVNFL